MRLLRAIALSFNNIMLEFENLIESLPDFFVENNENSLDIVSIARYENKITLKIKDELNIKHKTHIKFWDQTHTVLYHTLYKSSVFNDRFLYNGTLGIEFSEIFTTFKVWTPIATKVSLCIYKNGLPTKGEESEKFLMNEKNGVWSTKIYKNLKNYYYTYEVTVNSETNEAVDPYAIATGANGIRAAIIDLADTNPPGFKNDKSPVYIKKITDTFLYEISVRDFTIYPNTWIHNKGKYLGLIEKLPDSRKSDSIGIRHIKSFGITHIQLMPIFDFSEESVDELSPRSTYNWGYDPQNYNVPEGSYSSDPTDPLLRIKELKETILKFHKYNLYVNMDVVFNHVYYYPKSNFQKIFPDYYFRFYDDGVICNGSGCGNDIATENLMARKFIIDSIMYWAKEYHMDGFRFDLMGLMDFETINKIKEELNSLNRFIMVYGEGWDLNTNLKKEAKAITSNSYKIPNVAFFNDFFRDSVKGNVFSEKERGYINGNQYLEDQIKNCILGSPNILNSPIQSINYICCHDNLTIWDKLQYTSGELNEDERKEMVKLGYALIITSQGIPFFQSGSEFCRSKAGMENTYSSPDYINWIDWDKRLYNLNLVQYITDFIKIRKKHPAFRFDNYEDAKKHIEFLGYLPSNVVGFLLKDNANGDSFKNIIVYFNPNKRPAKINLPEGSWNLIGTKKTIGEDIIAEVEKEINLESISATVLYRQ